VCALARRQRSTSTSKPTGTKKLGERWSKAVTSAVLRILKNPRSGVPCQFGPAELHSIRRIPISGFPKHLIFYSVEDRTVLILRVLHGARDLESLL
jgi:toxin ParE1/3/4